MGQKCCSRANVVVFWFTVIGLGLAAFGALIAIISVFTAISPRKLLIWWPAGNAVEQPNPVDTTDWQTFRNEEYRFEVMYPNDWRLRTKNENTIIDKENCKFSIWQVPNDYINEQLKIKDELLRKGCHSEQQNINGIEFEKITCPKELLLAEVTSGEYHSQKDGRYYVIGLSNFAELLKAKGEPLPLDYDTECQSYFSQILSTFKFTEPVASTVDTTDWKTYRSDTYGFTFEYPGNWMKQEVSTEETGVIISLRTPELDQYIKEHSPYEGPLSNFSVSFWKDINNEYARNGSWVGMRQYANLEDFLTDKNSFKQMTGITLIGGKKAYEIINGGFSQNFAVMIEYNGIYEMDFDAMKKSNLTATQKQILSTFKFTQDVTVTKFTVSKRVPEGTTNSMPDAAKVLSEPLSKVELFFNRDIDVGSVTNNHVYVLSGIDNPESATLFYSSQDKKITINLINPFKIAGARLTVVVDGVRDTQGDILKNYLYNIDFK